MKVIELLKLVNMEHRADHKPSSLSGGEQQRIAISRAIANSPEIIIADEPTGNLDEDTSAQIMEILLRLNQEYETTLIMITHNTGIASEMQFQHKMENGQLNLLPNV